MIKDYIKYRITHICFLFCVLLFFPLVHFLYGFSMDSILYSCLLFTFVFVVWLIVDGLHYWDKCRKLDKILENMTWDTHNLPQNDNWIERKYQNIIESFYHLVHEKNNMMEKSHTDQIEYYTMWVHQIKTPISAMGLALQNKDQVDLAILNQELFKIEQYVEMAIQYVKIRQIASDLVIRNASLLPLVNQCVKKYAPLFIYKKISLEIINFDFSILTDSKWLSFIIEQLLSNAIKYTKQGGIKIYMENKSLIISDTGIGIRSEDMERIFEKGYTGYNGRLDKKASGLGLYLVKKVADSLAIQVDINSEVGHGTKAILTFPNQDTSFIRNS